MKILNEKMKVSIVALAVQGALVAMFTLPLVSNVAFAADGTDDEAAALKHPANSVEMGVSNVSVDSAKFGEYYGLNKSGAYFLGNFNIRGGNAYDGGNGTTRWDFSGNDLGTTSRSLNGSMSNQGQWNLNIGYDELRHNISDTFQTPQQGSMGGNNFTMPANFGTIDAVTNPSTRVLNTTQLGAFHTEEVGTTRKNTSFGVGYNFNPQLSLQFNFNHLDQSGAKLIGTGSQGGIALTGGSTGRAEGNNIIMNPTNYQTDTFNLALNWAGDKAHLSGGYYGSIFQDGYNSLSWQNALASGASACVGVGCYVNNTMSTAPDNVFHQLNLSGGYAFSPTTKLAGGFSYGRNTQNDSYAPTSIMQASGTAFDMMQAAGLPQSSLDGLVNTAHVDLKLTNQTTKSLGLSAGFKYNDRDNRTTSNTYLYKNLGNVNYTGVNTPYSNKKTQIEVAADYRLTKGQNLRLAYERENIKRWCNDVVGGAQCVASPSSNEDKLGLTYRLKAREDVSFNVGYSHAQRDADFDQSYLSNVGNRANVTAGSASGVLNGGDFLGFAAYPYAARKQDLVKAGVNWQSTEKLDLGLSGRYASDKYDATLGVQEGRTVGINLDATYSYNENGSISAYASWQNSERELRNAWLATNTYAAVAPLPGNIWTNQLKDDSNAIGLNAKQRGLMGGKLEILGDLSYSIDKTAYSTQVPYNAACATAAVLTCGDVPNIESKLLTFKITGNYQIDKTGKISVGYNYQQLRSADYYYNGLQYGSTPNRVMPTMEQAPNYDVHVIAASYLATF